MTFMWVDSPYFTRLRSGFGIWGRDRSLIHPPASAVKKERSLLNFYPRTITNQLTPSSN
ncbi:MULTISPECIES: hypothetical protein [unclassified Microcoleus]|uniref:hypothetical protein n=1 Tax=unclassified Microcoleus TaxID=2642155 RepID=UPI002FD5E1FB